MAGASTRPALRILLSLGLVLWVVTSASGQDRRTGPQPPEVAAGQDEPDRAGPAPTAEGSQSDEPEAQPSPQFDEEVVVVGSRARPRSVTESTVPIDVVPAADVVRQGGSNLADQLRVLIPSFHVNPQEDGDMAAVVRPASLRGWPPTIRWCW